MVESGVKIPGRDHPIAIVRTSGRVVVRAGGRVVADSLNALTLTEASYPPVQYIPRADVDMDLLVATDHTTHCLYKGDASYFSVPAGGDRATNAVWSYVNPHPAVAAIAGHVAFYPNRVDAIEVTPS